VNPYVFFVGCPRSGTTLLQRMLDHHPELAVSNDPDFVARAIGGGEEAVDPPVGPEIADRVLGYRTFRRLGVSEEAVRAAAQHARTFSEFVSGIYTALARERGKRWAGEKTARYVRYLPLLDRLFPWVRIVHIVRDGRDVALSTLEWAHENRGPGKLALWAEEPVAVCALWWRWHVLAGRRYGPRLRAARYTEVRYENLLAYPAERLGTLTSFFGLRYSPKMLEYHEGKTRANGRLSAKEAWLPPTPGLRDWRAQMPTEDVALFEALAGDALSSFGYERAVTSIPREVRSRADECRDWWAAEIEPRQARRELAWAAA
jgi:hypothetical protein